MARKAEWIVRLPACLQRLRAVSSVAIPAGTLADLLKINLRRAQQICQPFASPEYGGMAERKRLIAGLEAIAEGEDQRLAKVREVIADATHDLFLHRIAIPVPPEIAAARKLRKTKMADLPQTITIEQFNLHVTGKTLTCIIEQLRQFCIACANDEERIVTAIEGPPAPPPPKESYYLRADERGEIFIETTVQ